jgi:hypothetical protein
MKPKPHKAEPETYAEFLNSHAHRLVRLYFSNGEKREGVMTVHKDYVTLEDQPGGFPLAHIVGVVPMTTEGSDAPHAHSPHAHAPRPRKTERS